MCRFGKLNHIDSMANNKRPREEIKNRKRYLIFHSFIWCVCMFICQFYIFKYRLNSIEFGFFLRYSFAFTLYIFLPRFPFFYSFHFGVYWYPLDWILFSIRRMHKLKRKETLVFQSLHLFTWIELNFQPMYTNANDEQTCNGMHTNNYIFRHINGLNKRNKVENDIRF